MIVEDSRDGDRGEGYGRWNGSEGGSWTGIQITKFSAGSEASKSNAQKCLKRNYTEGGTRIIKREKQQ